MKKNWRIFIIGIFTLFVPFSTYSQDVEELLSKYTSENGQKYLQPFANAFSANLNSGLFHNAKLKKLGFQMYLGLESQVAIIPTKHKFMTATTEGEFFPKTTVKGVPTLFGPTEGKKVEDDATGLVYVFPGGLDIDYLPMVTPQLTIGSVYGTDVTLRYAGTKKAEDIGKIELFGYGIRHSIDQYIPLMPLNIAIGYYNQSFKVGDYMDASTSLVSLQAAYSVPVVTFYGGLGFENGKMKIAYEHEDVDSGEMEDIKFNLTPANKMRMTLGLGLNLGPVKLHGEYNIANQSTVSVGLGIGINEK